MEITGLALGIWALVGLVIHIYRRLVNKRVRVVTTRMDWVVLLMVPVSVVTSVLIATLYRFGSNWFTGVFSPYLLFLPVF